MTTSRPVCSTCGGAVHYQWDPSGFIHAEAAGHPVRGPMWVTSADATPAEIVADIYRAGRLLRQYLSAVGRDDLLDRDEFKHFLALPDAEPPFVKEPLLP